MIFYPYGLDKRNVVRFEIVSFVCPHCLHDQSRVERVSRKMTSCAQCGRTHRINPNNRREIGT